MFVRMPFVTPKENTLVMLSSLWPVSLTPSGGSVVSMSAERPSPDSSWSLFWRSESLRTTESWYSVAVASPRGQVTYLAAWAEPVLRRDSDGNASRETSSSSEKLELLLSSFLSI
jgi:hypothetical protein